MTVDGAPQHTIARPAECAGVALHTGEQVHLRLECGEPDTGVVFVRADLDGRPEILVGPAAVDHAALARRTQLRAGEASVATPEHLLATCLALGVDNVRVVLDGPEVPIFDGSAQPFVELLERAGRLAQDRPRRVWRLRRPVSLVADHAEIHALPADRMEVAFFARLEQAGIPNQCCQALVEPASFTDVIAPARTFTFYDDVQPLLEAGLIKGGSLDSAIVLRDGRPMRGDYRMPEELARHKLLDLIGDFAILGRPLSALVTARATGHALHHAFIERLRKELEE